MGDTASGFVSDVLATALADYLTRIDGGETVCREEFLARYPDCASALREHFANLDFLRQFGVESAISPPDEATALPRAFGDYELIGEIGRGGMGVVYRAKEHSTGRHVALKMLQHGWYFTSSAIARFRNEASTAARIRHPGIVPIYHVGIHDGRWFYTMPLIEGSSLADRIAQGAIDPQVAARLLQAVAKAIAAAHAAGIIHRDLKPANVLLDKHDAPYVGDFGLARRLDEETPGLTMTGDLLGTPNFMAPEQVNSRSSLVGPLADVYALGAMLYAMLIGQPPFHSDSVSETFYRICNAEPIRLRQIRSSIPQDLETICLKCLEKSPAARYLSAAELADDLQRYLSGEPLRARPISRVERGRRWFVRNPVAGTLAIGIALALFAGTGLSLHYARQAVLREEHAVANLYAAEMNLAQQHMQNGAVRSALTLLERHQPPDGDMNAASWEWRHLWHQCHGELRRFEGPQSAVYAAAFSPDGRTVAAAGADHTVWIWNTATGKRLHQLRGHTDTVRGLAFAPDGARMVTVSDDCNGIVWDANTGKRLATFAPAAQSGEGLVVDVRPMTTVSFSPDGRFIAAGCSDQATVNLWDAASYELVQTLDLGPVESLAFSPIDARLAIAGRDGCTRLCEPDGSGLWKLTETIQAHTEVIHSATWSPSGAQLATAGADRTVKRWDTRTWREVDTLGPFSEAAYCVRFSPDGRRLAVSVRNKPLSVWEIHDPHSDIELYGHTGLVTSLAFCPDGWRLVSASEDGTVRLWDAKQVTGQIRLEGHQAKVRTIAFSPLGNTLASGSVEGGSIILWDAATFHPKQITRVPQGTNELAYSPDGRSLASASGIGSTPGYLQIWDVNSNRKTLDTALTDHPLCAIAWAPDGMSLAVQSVDGMIRLIASSNGDSVAEWTSSSSPHGSLAFTHDGKRLLAAGGDNVARIWDVKTRSLVHELHGHVAPVITAVFNAESTLIATSSNDHTIRLWDAATGEHARTFIGHSGTTFGLAFSNDGARLASSSTDGSVKLWDVVSGLEVQSLAGHTHWARDVAFSPDGESLASAGYDGTVRIWKAPSQVSSSLEHREAAALVRNVVKRGGAYDDVTHRIESDQTVDGTVRAAAMQQVQNYPLYWPAMLEGHLAAERHDWSTAVDAFRRATDVGPHDVMHWCWLAMASLAADQPQTYRQSCKEMSDRINSESRHDGFWPLRAWLVASPDEQQLALLKKHVDSWKSDSAGKNSILWLYALRTGQLDDGAHDNWTIPVNLGVQPEDWYILAMIWLKRGDTAKAAAAYQTGASQARSGNIGWDTELFREMLRREVEAALRAASPAASVSSAVVTPGAASLSDSLPGAE